MSRIRQCFPSRYKDGLLIEADYSQLEIVVLAYLSNDENLIKDLISGRDLHRMRASQLYTTPEHQITPEQRREGSSPALVQGIGLVSRYSLRFYSWIRYI